GFDAGIHGNSLRGFGVWFCPSYPKREGSIVKVYVFQHVAFEGIGSMQAWLTAKNAAVGYTRFYEPNAALPALDGLDLLIIMGGPMSVNDEADLPWLVAEKAFIRK